MGAQHGAEDPADWPGGVYLGRLTRVPESPVIHAWQSFIVFVVRDRRKADVLRLHQRRA